MWWADERTGGVQGLLDLLERASLRWAGADRDGRAESPRGALPDEWDDGGSDRGRLECYIAGGRMVKTEEKLGRVEATHAAVIPYPATGPIYIPTVEEMLEWRTDPERTNEWDGLRGWRVGA